MRYAIIENGLVTNVVEADEAWAATQEGAVQTDSAGIGWTYAKGAFAAPEASLTDAEKHAALVLEAKAALEASDMVANRCFKAGVPFPADWLSYVQKLRAIANGTDVASTALPASPDLPIGT